MEGIKLNAMAELIKIPKQAFRRCFHQWQYRWNKCLCARAQGSFIKAISYSLP
jgi:hypothetical protein